MLVCDAPFLDGFLHYQQKKNYWTRRQQQNAKWFLWEKSSPARVGVCWINTTEKKCKAVQKRKKISSGKGKLKIAISSKSRKSWKSLECIWAVISCAKFSLRRSRPKLSSRLLCSGIRDKSVTLFRVIRSNITAGNQNMWVKFSVESCVILGRSFVYENCTCVRLGLSED